MVFRNYALNERCLITFWVHRSYGLVGKTFFIQSLNQIKSRMSKHIDSFPEIKYVRDWNYTIDRFP